MKRSRSMRNSWPATRKRKTFVLQATICLAIFLTVDSVPGYSNELLDRHPDLESRMTALLRWANFWQRQNQFKNYSPGKTVTVTAFHSGTRVETYLPEIDVHMSFAVGTKGELLAMGSGLLRGEPVDQVARRRLRLAPEVRVKSVSPERTIIEDHHPGETDVLKGYRMENFSFQLPALTLSDYVRLKTVPRELGSLKVVVGQAMVKWLCPEGAPLPEATIPYFDVKDPWVYVAVDGNDRQRGYFEFRWRDGKWISSKEWWPDPWKRSEVISLVRRHVLSTVKIDCPP